jgi:polyisoprenyl-teichoic acid--peptidoglycan teichoic acid transferase
MPILLGVNMANETNRPFHLGRFLGTLLSRLVLIILVLAVGWSVLNLIQLTISQSDQQQQLTSRQTDYEGTATAINNVDDLNAFAMELVAQFVTNTPIANAPEATSQPAGGSLFVTNTPQFMPSATPLPTTPIPTQETLVQPTVQPTAYVVPTFFPAPAADIAQIAGTAVPTPVPLIARSYELVNIMLMGSDEEVSQDNSIRTDTMIIVSINTQTRTVNMLSLPRDLFVYIPTPTMGRLNTVYGIGESFGWEGGGWEILRETIFYNFGINVHYYAKVNFSGFETIIDTLGGIDIAVDCPYEDYYPKAVIDLNLPVEQNYELRQLPIGYYRMNGFDALWYSRTRRVSIEFDRGRRQQQVLRAMMRAALAQGLIQNVPQLWGDITQVVETNIPTDVMLGLVPIALELDPDTIQNYTMQRLYHTTPWQPTDGPYTGQAVQLPNYDPIRELLVEFYEPPTLNQVDTIGARVVVYNGTASENLDRVAVEKLREMGVPAIAGGNAPTTDYTTSVLTDFVADEKGSPVPAMLEILNFNVSQVQIQPDPNRTDDYTVILGADFNPCDAQIVTPEEAGQ